MVNLLLPLKKSRSDELGRLRLGAVGKLGHVQLVVGENVVTVIRHKKWPLGPGFLIGYRRRGASSEDEAVALRRKNPATK